MKVYLLLALFFIGPLSALQAQQDSRKAMEMYQYAAQYFQEGRLSVALTHADEAIRLMNKFPEAYILRADIKEDMADLRAANTDYSILLHLDPEHSAARFQRAVNYYRMKRFQEAMQDFHVLLKNPSRETTRVYFKGKSGPQGFSASNVTTLQSDMRADILNYLALSHFANQALDSASFYIQKAILRNPREPDYYVNRGLLHEARRDTVAAVSDYQRALSYQSDHADALANLYKLSRNTNYDQLLAETYDLAVSEQASYQAYLNRAVYRQNNGNHRLAIRDFNQALLQSGTDAEVLTLRAYSKERTANLKGALQDYSQALKINPMLAKAYSNRANVYYKLKSYQLAVTDYNRAIEFFPESAKLFYNRGLALYLNGQRTDACIDLHKAMDMGYVNARAPIRAYCED